MESIRRGPVVTVLPSRLFSRSRTLDLSRFKLKVHVSTVHKSLSEKNAKGKKGGMPKTYKILNNRCPAWGVCVSWRSEPASESMNTQTHTNRSK